MQSTLVFLGTGGDSFTVGRQSHGSGGILIGNDEIKLHVDPGPGTLNRLKSLSLSPRETTAVICTHKHVGHCNDVNAYIDAMTHNGLDKKGVLIASDSVINGTESEHAYVTEFHKNCVERIITIKPGSRIGIEDFEIVATKANHSDETTVGLKILTPDSTIGYTSDTTYSTEIAKQYEDCDILILNVTHPFNSEGTKFGLSSEDAVKMIKKASPTLAVITHFGVKMLKADPILEAREIKKQSGIQTVAAKDGAALTPSNYSAKSPQKRLSSFED